MKYLLSFFILLQVQVGFAQIKNAYQLYTANGEKIEYVQMVEDLISSDVILFGELHNNALCHWLQLELFKDLHSKKGEITLGMEMFETDDQIVIDEYFNGLIKEKHLLSEAKVWDNYNTDYKPLVEFAKSNNLQLIATNTPRRYASIVANMGKNSLKLLNQNAKNLFCDLPYKVDTLTPGYAEILSMDMGHGTGMNNINFLEAQALKDATMAQKINENLKSNFLFYHINGDFHSKQYGGIFWYLKKLQKQLNIKVISTVEAEDVNIFNNDWKDLADYILVIPENMSKSY